MYRDPLPSRRTLKHLGELIGPYPISGRHVSLEAERYAFSPRALTFLRAFPSEELFYTKDDFIARCEELKMLLNVEHKVSLGVAYDAQDPRSSTGIALKRLPSHQHFFGLLRHLA